VAGSMPIFADVSCVRPHTPTPPSPIKGEGEDSGGFSCFSPPRMGRAGVGGRAEVPYPSAYQGQGEVGEAASSRRIVSNTPSRLSITSLFQKRMTR
jgi:hypothetical protein